MQAARILPATDPYRDLLTVHLRPSGAEGHGMDQEQDKDRPPANVIVFPARMARARAASRIAYRRKREAERGDKPNPWLKVLELLEKEWEA